MCQAARETAPGMWIVPYFIDEREEVFPAGMTDSMDFTAWEVDRNDG